MEDKKTKESLIDIGIKYAKYSLIGLTGLVLSEICPNNPVSKVIQIYLAQEGIPIQLDQD